MKGTDQFTMGGIPARANGIMKFLAALLFLLPLVPLQAELAPSAYEQMQAKAPEYLKIEVLRVDIEPGEKPADQKVHIVAMVNEVIRSTAGIKPDEIINIFYIVEDHPKPWAGPGATPILAEKDQTIAYLKPTSNSGEFEPAAGRMSFSNF
ncbi:hypothetical protein BH09VER1_BH09VER1_20500 [soil metagenome]